MSEQLEISSGTNFEAVIDKIIKANENIIDYYIIEEAQNKNIRYIFYVTSQRRLEKEHIAELLGEWILRIYEPEIMSEILQLYFADNEFDRQQIISAVTKRTDYIRYFYNKGYIVKKITNYLKSENVLQIEGFIRFRLPEYRQELYNLLYDAVEEFYIEKEYEEFIDLLSTYINQSQPMIDLLHINHKSDGEFLFYDFTKTNMRFDAEKTTAQNPIENFLTNEDMLVSILIALAPKRIIWHSSKNVTDTNISKTISSIFKDRFSVCCGCELCDKE